MTDTLLTKICYKGGGSHYKQYQQKESSYGITKSSLDEIDNEAFSYLIGRYSSYKNRIEVYSRNKVIAVFVNFDDMELREKLHNEELKLFENYSKNSLEIRFYPLEKKEEKEKLVKNFIRYV